MNDTTTSNHVEEKIANQTLFRTEALRQRIELINHLIEFGRQLIVIVGPKGYGKSTLIKAIQEAAEETWVFINFNGGPTLNRTSLLEKISSKLDFEPAQKFSEAEVCDEIRRRLDVLQRANQFVIVCIDDADALPSDTHGLLLDLAHHPEDGAELRVLMSADPSDSTLVDNLQQLVSHQALVHRVDLPKMDREQTASLLSWWSDQQAPAQRKFSSAGIDEIYAESEGVPGAILILARQSQLAGHGGLPLRQDPVQRYVLLGAVGLLLLCVFAFFAKDPGPEDIVELEVGLKDDQPQAKTTPISEPDPTTVGRPTEDLSEDNQPILETNVPLHLDAPAAKTNLPNPTIRSVTAPLVVDQNLDDMLSAQLINDLTPTSEDVAIALPEPETPIAQPLPGPLTAPMSAPEKSPSPEPSTATTPKISVKIRDKKAQPPEPVTPPPPPAPTLAKAKTEPKPKVVVKNPPKAIPKKVAPKVNPTRNYTLANLFRHEPDNYVLQLFGVRDRDAAQKYVEKQSISKNSIIIHSTHDGQPWYVLIYGSYPDREAADVAAKALAKTLPQTSPWPRSVASLK